MAEVPVRSKEIIEDGLFAPTIASGKELETVLESLKISFAAITKETKAIAKSNNAFGSAAQVNEYTAALEKQQAVRKVVQKTEEQLLKQKERERLAEIRLDQQREKAFDNYEKKLQKEKAALEKQNSAYNKLSKTVNELRKQYKDVAVAQGENSKAAKMLLAQLTPLDTKLKQIDANAGQFQRNVGNYPRVFGLAANAVKSLASAFGLFFGLRAVVGLFQNFVGTFRQFEDVNVRVASVLGTTTENTKELTEDAKRLGATTAKSATEVLLLQEAYARLGFTQKEILNLTEPTINGSIALNAELDQTAELVGAVVNSFDDFDSANAPEILDQMTLATQRSALNFSYLETALPIVGAAANSAGVSFTELLSNLGKLADGGLDASTAATSLRNIFIESSTQGKNYREILGDIANSTDALVNSNEDFGKRGAVAATILSGQIDATKELETVLKDAGGTAERVANENLKTLSGAIILLKSAWQGFMLSLEEGNGTFGKALQTITRVTTEILTLATGTEKAKDQLNEAELRIRNIAESVITFGKAISAVVVGYAAFRTAIIAANAVIKLNNLLVKSNILQQTLYTTAVNIARKAQERFNAASKANIIGIVVGLLVSAVAAFKMFTSSANEATKAQDDFNRKQEEGLSLIEKNEAVIERANNAIATGLRSEIERDKILGDIQGRLSAIQFQEITLNNARKKALEEWQKEKARIEKRGGFTTFIQEIEFIEERIRIETGLNEEQIATISRQAEQLEKFKLAQFKLRKKTENKVEEKEIIDYEKEVRDSIIRQLKDEEIRRKATAWAAFRDKIDGLKKEGKFRNELEIELRKELDIELQKIEDDIAQRKLAKFKSEQEMFFDAEIIELETQLLQIEDETTQAYKDLQAKILKLKIEQLEKELEEVKNNAELSNAEKFKREQEILFEIATLNKTTKKKELETERDYLKQGTDALQATLDERNNLRQRYFELETQERDRQIQIQSDRAAAGLTNQLAFEEAQQKKAAQSRKEQLKREAREREAFALSEVFVNSLNTNLKAGDSYGVAAGKALASVGLAKGISKSLQYFEEGSEYVTQKGKKSPFSKGKDTVDAVIRVGEGIVTTEANQAYKGVVGAMNKGIFHELYTPKKVAVGVAESMANNVLLMQQMKANRLLEKIASKPAQMIEFDNFGNIIETVYRASIKERTTYKNSLSRFKK